MIHVFDHTWNESYEVLFVVYSVLVTSSPLLFREENMQIDVGIGLQELVRPLKITTSVWKPTL